MNRQLSFVLLLLFSVAATAQVYVLGKPKVYVEATADIFSSPNKKFAPQLKNALRENGWNVVSKKADAEYTLTVAAEAREYKKAAATYEVDHNLLQTSDSLSVVTYDKSVSGEAVVTAYGYGERGKRNYTVTESTRVKTDYVDIQTQGDVKDYIYFAYLDAYITFSFGDEVLYEDVLEIKEGHTNNFEEAATLATKKLITKLTEILPTKTKRRI